LRYTLSIQKSTSTPGITGYHVKTSKQLGRELKHSIFLMIFQARKS
jgi:hypothetical protein